MQQCIKGHTSDPSDTFLRQNLDSNLVLELGDFDHEPDEGGDGHASEDLVRAEAVILPELLHPEIRGQVRVV